MRIESRELLAVGIFGGKSRIGDRIDMLLRRGRTFSPRASSIGVAASAIVLCALMLGGSLAPRWIAFAQTAARPAFEVASVKLRRNATDGGPTRIGPQGIDIPGGRLSEIIADAYQIPYSRISPPSNASSSDVWNARYEIAARAGHSVSREQLMLMVRTLLEDRFKLALHHEPKVVPVFKLVIGKNGPRLKESAAEGPPSGAIEANGITIRNTELWRFCAMLSGRMGRPVVDLTGLKGSYDFTLRLDVLEGVSTSEPDYKSKVSDWSSSSIYSDIQKQLGLRLEADKAPVDYLVLDHVEQPDAN